jgi:protein-S-isoprenylcysteine O-methyltransferase Ste14
MIAARFFDWFQVAALACWGILGVGRALMFHRRGVRVLAVDRQRTWSQMAVDLAAALCLVLWAYEVIVTAFPSTRFLAWPTLIQIVVVDHLAVKFLGILAVATGLSLYGIALRDLGVSWRLGIDRKTPGPLVMEGVYAWSRHPIYVAFDLVFVGAFLVQGRIVFLVLAAIMVTLLHSIILREEQFLAQAHGEAYQNYCRHVGRYLSLRVRT